MASILFVVWIPVFLRTRLNHFLQFNSKSNIDRNRITDGHANIKYLRQFSALLSLEAEIMCFKSFQKAPQT